MENSNLKLNLHRLKSIILQNKYYKKITNNEKESNILLLMNKYIKNLKEIDLIYTMADIEAIKYDNTSYPDTLYTNEMINRFNFYSIILGYIEGNIDNLNKLINMNYIFTKDIELIKNKLLEFILFREKINEELKKYKYNSEYKILTNIIEKNPSYKNFTEFFLNIKNKNYYNVENLEIIISYTIGYKNFNKFDFINIYSEYLNLVIELDEYKNKNREKLKKVKEYKKIK